MDYPHQTILDLGCGTGLNVELLTNQGYRTVGIEFNSEGLKAISRSLPGTGLVQANATRLPLRSNVFDVAMLLDILEHVDDKSTVRELQRVLRPGGIAVITVPAIP